MAGKIVSSGFRGLLSGRPYSAQSAAVAAKKLDQHAEISFPKEDMKMTTLPNGLVIASLENYSSISRVGVIVKAGPRYEKVGQLGISHCLRNCAGLSVKKHTVFGITRNIEQHGGNFQASCSKENMFYELSCNRDHMDTLIPFLARTVTQPLFHPWEVKDYWYRMEFDLEVSKADHIAVLIDSLHKAAYKGGLRNSLFSPDYMLGKHDSDMLNDYLHQTYGSQRAAIVALGVNHELLLENVDKFFEFKSGAGATPPQSKYKGGELFIDADLPVTYAAVVAEGAGLNKQNELLCLAILQKVLGEGPRIKYSEAKASKLGAAAAKATSNPFAVSGLNLSYSDTGLFGFWVAGAPSDMDKLIKDLVTEMRTLKKVTEKEISIAKQSLKTSLYMSHENQSSQLEDMAISALLGRLVTTGDLEKAIDAISPQEITAVATKVLKGKPSLVAYGPLANTPCLDELV